MASASRLLLTSTPVPVKRTWLIVAVVAAATLLTANAYVHERLGWVDSISGARKSQTHWRLLGPSTPVVSESPLAARYRKLGLQWEPDWRNVEGTSVGLFGLTVARGHGPAPEIY